METRVKAHLLRINNCAALAACSCGGWTVEGFTAEYAKRNHQHHLAGLPDSEKEKGTKK